MDLVARDQVRDRIHSCTNCPLHLTCTKPVPFSGPNPAKIAIIGEAPGRHEDVQNRPFVGPAGQLAHRWLERVGIADNDCAWLNVVCCFPHRTPTRAEVARCSGNLRAQLSLLQPRFLLLFGGVAVAAFHPELKISEARGKWWRVPKYIYESSSEQPWAMGTWHPAAVLRLKKLEQGALEDLESFRLVCDEELEAGAGDKCVKCGGLADVWYGDIPWCGKHWGQAKRKKGQGRQKRKTTAKMLGDPFKDEELSL